MTTASGNGQADDTEVKGKLFLVIPAYNPGPGFPALVRKALPEADHICIVDDGCSAGEKEFLAEFSGHPDISILVHDANRGKGAALHTGIRYCLDLMSERDYILTMDSDGQHDPADITKFSRLLASRSGVDLALGERRDDDLMPPKSRVGNTISRISFRLLFGGKIHDTQTGFRLLSSRFARLFIERVPPGHYETEMEMLILASRTLEEIHSVTISTIYFDGNTRTGFRSFVDTVSIVRSFIKYGVVSVLSFLLDYLLFLVMTYLVGIPYLYSNALARILSAIANFLGHRTYSFKSKGSLAAEAFKYTLAMINALVLSSLFLYLSVDYLGIPGYIAKPIMDTLVFVINFYILSRLVFSERKLKL